MFKVQSFLKSHTQSAKRSLLVTAFMIIGLASPAMIVNAAAAPTNAPVALTGVAPIKWGEQPENCLRAYLVPNQQTQSQYNYSVHTTIDGKPVGADSSDYNWRLIAGHTSKTVEKANNPGDYFILADGSHASSVTYTVDYKADTPYCRDALPVCTDSSATMAYSSTRQFDVLPNCTDSDDTVLKLDSGQSYYVNASGAYADAGKVTIVKTAAGKKVLSYKPNFPLAAGHSQKVTLYYEVEDASFGRSNAGIVHLTVQN